MLFAMKLTLNFNIQIIVEKLEASGPAQNSSTTEGNVV